ncbi:MAG: CDP-glucose 4,6-dehydratase [Alphaproteobacteria bacterium]|nr:CDP-glucose 4,6-dehydratase [Alphaproteobacteria bacterium]
MESVVMNFWNGRRVLLTGHTGFKGGWLSLWLNKMGAQVTGLALQPTTEPSLFDQLGLEHSLNHHYADVRNAEAVSEIVRDAQPEIVFHLAAQPLVLQGYAEPVETWNVNVMGTIHVLQALRALEHSCAAVMVTTDKVYENREWDYGYREDDPLGGYDPYSSAKAAAEIAVSSWRRAFFSANGTVRAATARAGNVIGGGDWSDNRIVPDFARALSAGEPVTVRNRYATRPWQHVLEPLSGYLRLAQLLFENDGLQYQDAFNFGPDAEATRTVGDLVAECLKHWPGKVYDASPADAPHEAGKLALAVDRARERLDWSPRWSFSRGVEETVVWYRDSRNLDRDGVRELTLRQIQMFEDGTNEAK